MYGIWRGKHYWPHVHAKWIGPWAIAAGSRKTSQLINNSPTYNYEWPAEVRHNVNPENTHPNFIRQPVRTVGDGSYLKLTRVESIFMRIPSLFCRFALVLGLHGMVIQWMCWWITVRILSVGSVKRYGPSWERSLWRLWHIINDQFNRRNNLKWR